MISDTEILQNLTSIEAMYNSATSPKETLFYSKLCIIELCGWIEVSMDDIIKQCGTQHLKQQTSIDELNEIVKKTWGFKYDDNFKSMLLKTIGIVHYEQLSGKFDQVHFQPLIPLLNVLSKKRNDLAHTYVAGQAIQIDAPSVTISNFHKIFAGLKDIESTLSNHPLVQSSPP